MGGGLEKMFDLGGGENIHDTVVMNEKGCFSLGERRVCWRDGPSSKDFRTLKYTHRIHDLEVGTVGFRSNTRSNETTTVEEVVSVDGRTNAPQYLCLWVIHIPNIRPQDLKS